MNTLRDRGGHLRVGSNDVAHASIVAESDVDFPMPGRRRPNGSPPSAMPAPNDPPSDDHPPDEPRDNDDDDERPEPE
jgi:hypothetical protein